MEKNIGLMLLIIVRGVYGEGMKKIIIYILFMAGMVVGPVTPVGANVNCKDVQFVFARGSGQMRHASGEWLSMQGAVATQMASLSVSYGIYEVDYPAIAINFLNILPTFFSGGEAFAFGESVRAGATDIVRFARAQVAECPETKFVLMGYSQGAKVAARALGSLDARRVLYVATFGDPELYLPEGVGMTPPACRGEKLSRYRVYAPDCRTDNGILGARKPYELPGYSGKFGLWCGDDDLICGSSKNLLVNSGHGKYDTGGHVKEAVRQAILRIRREILGEDVLRVDTQVAMDTAILIDSTGSMSSYIAKYRAEALRLARLTVAGGGRVALYEYRDLNDPFDLRQLCDFSCSLEEFERKLNAIVTDGGGDEPESLLSSALGVMNSLTWRKGVTKSIVVLTDATYHAPDRDGTTVGQVAKRSLEIDPVNIYVVTEEWNREFYSELTELTGGKVFGVGEMEVSTDYIVSRPVAVLPFERYYGDVGERFYFDAGASYGVGAEINHFEWDLDGDGEFDYVSADSWVETEYATEGERFVVVKVVDRNGAFSTMSALVVVGGGETGAVVPSLTGVKAEKMSDGVAVVSWDAVEGVDYVLLAVGGAVLGYVPSGAGEVRISDLDLTDDIEIVVTGMDGEFNLGESAYAFLMGDEMVEKAVLTEVVENESEVGENVHMHLGGVELAGIGGMGLPGTGGNGGGEVLLVSYWALGLVSLGIGLIGGMRMKKRSTCDRSFLLNGALLGEKGPGERCVVEF